MLERMEAQEASKKKMRLLLNALQIWSEAIVMQG